MIPAAASERVASTYVAPGPVKSAVHAGEGEVPGLQRARRGGAGGIVRTDDNLLTDLIAFNVKSGRWPTREDWMVGTEEHASSRT